MNKTYGLILLLAVAACSPTATKNALNATYEEDISIHKNTYPTPVYDAQKSRSSGPIVKPNVEPTNHIRAELDSVLVKMKQSREDIGYIDGLTIEVYSGNNREKANEIKRKIYSLEIDHSPKITYDQPNYKVRVGEYYSRLEANKDLNLLKKKFESALLVPKRISL